MIRSRKSSARGPIYGALRSARSPMTAYQILDAVRPQGISAPPTVYRALARLVDEGLAHRVESLNAYVACVHAQHGEEVAIFAICRNCGSVDEIDDAATVSGVRHVAEGRGFKVEHMTVELRGLCAICADRAGIEAHDAGQIHDHGGES